MGLCMVFLEGLLEKGKIFPKNVYEGIFCFSLNSFKVTVDSNDHFGFLTSWKPLQMTVKNI